MADNITQLMLGFTCDYCGAEPTVWCTTKSGNRASFLHSARWWAWKDTQAEKHNK